MASPSPSSFATATAPLDLARYRKVPTYLLGAGIVLSIIGLITVFVQAGSNWGPALVKQFAFSWLLAFMFFLSLCLGGWFLVLVHHLFDASWSVPVRRVNEQIASLLFPTMAILFIPIATLARTIYPWMTSDPNADHALHAKMPLFTIPGFYIVLAACFFAWWFFPSRLRFWSLQQDQTGAAECTYKMRYYSSLGIFAFAVTLTFAAIMLMKALQHQWFSTMYGVYYFAGSVWTTLATVYVITLALKRAGPLRNVMHEKQFYFLGSLLFAFTVFYAYIHFAQYFIIWNGNMPEETFWYKLREEGTWWQVGMIIIFGHFFIPFLTLLRIDVKLSWIMLPIAIWAWLMHFIDLSFNIMPVLHPNGFVLHPFDLGFWALMAGILSMRFVRNFSAHPPYPQRDPRMAEGLDTYVPPATAGHAIAPRTQSEGGAR